EALKIKLLIAAAKQPQANRFTIDRWNSRDTHIDLLIAGVQVHSPILRQTALGDVHVGHDLEARDYGLLKYSQLRRDCHFVQNAVDPVSNSEIIVQRLD